MKPKVLKTGEIINFQEASALQPGDHILFKCPDLVVRRLKINGKPKLWKRQPEKIQIPYKYGIYEYGYLNERHIACNLLFREG